MTGLDRGADLPAALAEAKQLVLIAKEHFTATGERKKALSVTLHERLDTLIHSLLDNFPDEQVSVSEVKPLLERHRDLTAASLADVEDRVIPLVIVRELVSTHHFCVHQQSLPIWPRFVDRFRAVCYA